MIHEIRVTERERCYVVRSRDGGGHGNMRRWDMLQPVTMYRRNKYEIA